VAGRPPPSQQQLWQRAIRDDATLSAHERAAALVLSTYSDPDGSNAYPGVETIARGAGIGRSTAFRALSRLADLGWLEVRHLGPGRPVERVLRVPLRDPYPSRCGTPTRPAAGPLPVPLRDSTRPAAGLDPSRSGTQPGPYQVHTSAPAEGECEHGVDGGRELVGRGQARGPRCPLCRAAAREAS
jgi:hypothetical protein